MSANKNNIPGKFDPAWLDGQLNAIGRGAEKIIPLLQTIQEQYNYLPQDALIHLSQNSDISAADIAEVSTFYPRFRHTPAGRYDINVCVGTACHIKGAELVYDGFLRYLGCAAGEDTDPRGMFTVNKVACLGCCSLAPAVQVGGVIYGHVTAAGAGEVINKFLAREKKRGKKSVSADTKCQYPAKNEVRVCLGSCCSSSGTAEIESAVRWAAARYQLPINVKTVGCVGMCHNTPLVEVIADGESYLYAQVNADDIPAILLKHFRPQTITGKAAAAIDTAAEMLLIDESPEAAAERKRIALTDETVDNFFNRQIRIATEHYGAATPLNIGEYIGNGGFEGLKKCLTGLSADDVIGIVKESGLRGRGGAGFPAGAKWEAVTSTNHPYIICNGDEGDPGAFMDRMLLESFPYRIIEGMLIAAYAVGAREGIFYIRAEYPLAISAVRRAIAACEEMGIVGDNVFGTGFSITLSVVEGAGAFVCGEETALIRSIEGRRGMPTLKPPYPAERGLWGRPTLINNCETFACVPWIFLNGAEEFRKIGTPKSPGAKVFALAGKIARGGLIETPMGITIAEIVERVGGGIAGGKKFKAVQIGGPSGGCIPASMADTPVDYEALAEAGAMMGSGGLVVLDERDCVVDIAKYFLTFTQSQSCGRCTFCRIGTKQMLRILEKICAGKGSAEDLQTLEELAESVKKASLCGLGKTAPNPVITTMKYFRDEYEAHINGSCPAGKCKDLISYSVTEKCVDGCTICSQNCPVGAIPFAPYDRPVIDDDTCTRCGACKAACPEGAINIIPRKTAGAV